MCFRGFSSEAKNTAKYVLFAALVPGVTMQVTVFQVINQLGAFNTLMAPILLYIGTDIMAIYIFMQFIDSISKDLDEAALIEGASYFRVFSKSYCLCSSRLS